MSHSLDESVCYIFFCQSHGSKFSLFVSVARVRELRLGYCFVPVKLYLSVPIQIERKKVVNPQVVRSTITPPFG